MSETMDVASKLHQQFVIDKIKGGTYEKGPLVVELDTTAACNLECPGCISEELIGARTSFSEERLMQIGKELKEIGVKAVILIGGGEPLAHPAVGDFIEFIGKNDIHVGITTNGVFITRYMDEIAEYASWTRVSMDAATEKTFWKLRPSKDGRNKFTDIVDGMTELSKQKKGKLGFSYLIRTEADGFGIDSNVHEIYEAAKLAKEIGCDYFEVKPSYDYAGGKPHSLVRHSRERMSEAQREISRLDDLETEEFRIVKAINLKASLGCVQEEQNKDYHRCPAAELRTLICPSGVYVCPYWRGKAPFCIGDAREQSVNEIWNSERRKDVMERLDPASVCQFHCLRDQTNRDVLDILDMKKDDIYVVPEYDRFI